MQDRLPEQEKGTEGSFLDTLPIEIGSRRFNYKMAGITILGYMLGGAATELLVWQFVLDPALNESVKKLYGTLAYAGGGFITGFVIPVGIYNHAQHRTWRETWNRIIS
ncbi:hypothetical protein A3F00_03820 [Candidatus Daviesbacteria bacterium RIFCSPHIGHO2_12_FULL_37_11]|uniref:Uncharacterized protein n=1 Tax=Candidatus Daviesbacteria bacterium RIFCSPHIGHO2_12_FULL_37_11 TaxID=1797777 RepID=A0A1F5KBG3_9BACT|nr:MAG: hypothetical protein A2111_02645 [Candidatus Daviesbacteria bacterium GWA1_38_6]OGE38208.1 MAG: hypothetical protein A3F00_03820 [Candidatus Daviesbacteria bacterium RIFCSPHIGHO2_12_FULL_37_11]OGE45880.1 MAG: hypothetical protein A3B39_01605 [Candidatus Daviesbacteria bacterium RIFCSPLOWO2_01_FULL_37_10]